MAPPSDQTPPTRPSRRTVLAGGAAAAWAAPAVLRVVPATAATSDVPDTCSPTLLPVVNPGAEDGIAPAWTVQVGSPEASAHAVAMPGGVDPLTPPPAAGADYFGETDSTAEIQIFDARFSGLYQVLALPDAFLVAVDAGGATIDLSAWFAVRDGSGAGFVYARPFATFDEADTTPVPLFSVDNAVGLSPNDYGPAFDGPLDVWQRKAATFDVPVGSRYLHVDIGLADRISETPNGEIRAGVDLIEITACI